MKGIKSMLLVIVITLFSANSFADEPATKTNFRVSGNCDMCKKRIEKAAKLTGVKSAVWNTETGIMNVSFVPSVISADQIQQRIAEAGHDTDKYKASDEAYSKLHKCCRYERK
jgi:copper chaperone CopZ